jgi:hypothetical protein
MTYARGHHAVIIKENARSIPTIKQPMTMLKNVRFLIAAASPD